MSINTDFANPFILERADPYIMKGPDGYYYFTASYPMKSDVDPDGYDRVVLRRAKDVRELTEAEEITIWKATNATQTHRFIWAPELHFIRGVWYVFYSGSCRNDHYWYIDCHVLKCQGNNPYTDTWEELGRFGRTAEDNFSFTGFSLDMTYFEAGNRGYVIWAQHNEDKISCLYLGEVDPQKPYALISAPMLLTKPELPWEKVRFSVNEGPAVLKHDDKIYVAFSASGTGPEYCVGLLEADATADLLQPASWKKYDHPLFSSEDVQNEYGPGHNSFTKDADGTDLFVYHARSKECFEQKCGYSQNDPLFDPCRHARIRKIEWMEGENKEFPFRIC